MIAHRPKSGCVFQPGFPSRPRSRRLPACVYITFSISVMKSVKKVQFLLLAAVLMLFGADTYQKPPKVVEDILNSAATPTIQLSPTHAYAMQGRPVRYPPIAELAQPMRRLAGIRINPTTNGLHNATFNSALTLRKVPEGTDIKVALPANPKLSTGRWSPDGNHFAFTNTTDKGIEIWVGDAATGKTRHIESVRVNDVFGSAGGGRGGAATGGSVQWTGSPRWSRHHDRISSLSAMVSAGRRMYYIMDQGSR